MRAVLAMMALGGCVGDPCRGLEGPTLRVVPEALNPAGDPRRFSSVAEALAAAEPGAAVCVAPGHWVGPLRVEVEGLSLIGAGPGLSRLSPTLPAQDPREGDESVLTLAADGLRVAGFEISGGVRGVVVGAGHAARLEDLRVEANAVGLLANDPGAIELIDVELANNVRLGALVTGQAPFTWRGGALLGNGDAASSEVGGLHAEGDLELQGLRIRDNAGALAADVFTSGHLVASDLTVERPLPLQASPRLVAEDGALIDGLRGDTAGSPLLRVSCAPDSLLQIENLAATDSQVQGPAIALEGCTGRLAHLTLVDLSGEGPSSALGLSGSGHVELVNSALVGYAAPGQPEGWWGQLHDHDNFLGSAREAALLGPLLGVPDLRPQADSPLVDAGVELGTSRDLSGAARPRGRGPDIGAYELY